MITDADHIQKPETMFADFTDHEHRHIAMTTNTHVMVTDPDHRHTLITDTQTITIPTANQRHSNVATLQEQDETTFYRQAHDEDM